jgi:signal transduction histidine kinase
MIGALIFGLKGAVFVYIFITALYAPFIVMNWSNDFSFFANKILHALFSGAFALVAGFFVDREKKYRKQLEKERYLSGLGQAATAIVHDLRNPLIAITGFAKRIQEKKGNIDAGVQTIIDSAEKMQTIVHDVLDFAKPFRMSYKDENICKVIERAYDSSGIRASMKGVEVSVEQSPDTIFVPVDAVQLERALVNLINNAIDASEKDGRVIIFAAENNDFFVIRITDHGSGMDRETLENIFIPFYTRKRTGTGLGMAIAKKIIEGHRGIVDVTSKEGKGTEVCIRIPCRINRKA